MPNKDWGRLNLKHFSSITFCCPLCVSSRGGWQNSGTPLDLHDFRLMAIPEAERQLLEGDDDDDSDSVNDTGAAFFRSVALVVSHYNYRNLDY